MRHFHLGLALALTLLAASTPAAPERRNRDYKTCIGGTSNSPAEMPAVKAILMCLGLPARPPPVAPAREREQGAFEFDGGEAT